MRRNPGTIRSAQILAAIIAFWAAPIAQAALPQIDFIEAFLKTNVLIHFDTEASRTYVLQYTEQWPSAATNNASWTNLYVAPNIPFPNHYVILDTGTRRQRFYRLMVTP